MIRQESFEKHWADMHDIPAETLIQYRWLHQDGYRLPGIAAAYRNYCAGWDCRDAEARAEIEDRDIQDRADAEFNEHFHGEETYD